MSVNHRNEYGYADDLERIHGIIHRLPSLNPLFPTVSMIHLQPINCFVPASQANSKCVSRNAKMFSLKFHKNLASRKIIQILLL